MAKRHRLGPHRVCGCGQVQESRRDTEWQPLPPASGQAEVHQCAWLPGTGAGQEQRPQYEQGKPPVWGEVKWNHTSLRISMVNLVFFILSNCHIVFSDLVAFSMQLHQDSKNVCGSFCFDISCEIARVKNRIDVWCSTCLQSVGVWYQWWFDIKVSFLLSTHLGECKTSQMQIAVTFIKKKSGEGVPSYICSS